MKKIITIPNIITSFRIVLIPFFVILYFKEQYINAFAVIALSALSDITDGFIARKFNMISNVGMVLDPVADKLTQITLAVCLCFNHRILFPVLIVLSTKEFLTFVCAAIWFKNGIEPISAKWWGKVSTLLLYSSFMYYVLCDIFSKTIIIADCIFTVVTIAFMLFSMCGYIKTFIKGVREDSKE